MARKRKIATCHPERLHMAKGLCEQCYDKSRIRSPKALEKLKETRKQWAASNKQKRRYIYVKYHYDLSSQEYDLLWKFENGKCAICSKSLDFYKACVDHCHKSNVVRGLLCNGCNMAIGQFKDSPQMLIKAIYYLLGINDGQEI